MLLLLIHSVSSTALEAVENEGPIVGSSSHWIHVQKCCPQAYMMVEVASRTTATTHGTGSKFECQLQNDTSFRWAPNFLDDQNNLMPFEGTLDSDHVDSDDYNITKFCIPNGPCISAIVGKPQCGPVIIRLQSSYNLKYFLLTNSLSSFLTYRGHRYEPGQSLLMLDFKKTCN